MNITRWLRDIPSLEAVWDRKNAGRRRYTFTRPPRAAYGPFGARGWAEAKTDSENASGGRSALMRGFWAEISRPERLDRKGPGPAR